MSMAIEIGIMNGDYLFIRGIVVGRCACNTQNKEEQKGFRSWCRLRVHGKKVELQGTTGIFGIKGFLGLNAEEKRCFWSCFE